MTSNVHIVYGDDEGIMFEVSSSRNPTSLIKFIKRFGGRL